MFTAALDISTFIWNPQDFERNKHHYYELISLSPTVFSEVKKNKIPILLRGELYELLLTEFPYVSINGINPDYGRTTLSFLVDVNWTIYADGDTSHMLTNPNIIKAYFSEDIKRESGSQIVHLFQNVQPEIKFITYHCFYEGQDDLLIERRDDKVKIETLNYSSEKEITTFFDKHKIKFKHNPKHDKYKAGGKISPLSCYNERTADITYAQKLLDTSCQVGSDFYNYDSTNEVYVVFVDSNDGTFHGFDLSDEGDNVPEDVKKTFNKNGRQF